MMKRPRALHIAPIMPARSGNGLAMRQGMFLDALSREFETHLVVLPVAGRPDAASTLPDELGIRVTHLSVTGRQDTHFALLARLADPAARVSAFRAYGRSSLAACLSVPVLNDLRAALDADGYDLVHIGRSYLADSLRVTRGRVATLDIDEDEWMSYREMADILRPDEPEKAAWADAEAEAFTGLIGKSLPGVDRFFISNEPEAREIAGRHPGIDLEVVRNAVAIPPTLRRAHDGATLLFLGSFSYPPNLDAANWFVDAIWPSVRSKIETDARLLLVGRDAQRVAALGEKPGVEIWTDVEDIAEAFSRATVFVSPLRAGAGTRLKLLEAAAHGVPMVSTSLGSRGLPFQSGRDLLIADDEQGFAQAILEAIGNETASTGRAASVRSIVAGSFDVENVTAELSCRLRDLAARGTTRKVSREP